MIDAAPTSPPARATATRTSTLEAVRVLWPVALLVASAGRFLPHQSLWVDETTQLSGLSLGPARLLPWLAGRPEELGVPPDRMPPLSYLLQMAWAGLAGLSEPAMRWLGLGCAVLGVALAALAAARAFGRTAGTAVALFLSLSPNVALYGVEIRAYPLFFLLSGAAVYALVRAVEAEGRAQTPWLVGLSAVLLLAVYTHFFGLVLAGAAFAGLLADALVRRRRQAPIWIAGVGVAVASAGLLPFVTASTAMAGSVDPTSPAERLRGIVKLVYRLYGHPAMSASRPALLAGSAGFALVAGAALLDLRRRQPIAVAAAAALAAGALAVSGASLVAGGFDPVSPHYNLWMLPLCALLLAGPLSGPPSRLRHAALAGGAALLAGVLLSDVALHREPDLFAHGPQRRILALLRELGPERAAVVYDQGTDAGGHLFFPVRYTFGRGLPQYLSDGTRADLVSVDPKDAVPPIDARTFAVIVRLRHVPAASLRALADDRSPIAPLPAAERLRRQGWTSLAQERIPALVAADLEVLRRTP